MSASDIRDPYANLTGSARRRAVARARECAVARREVTRAMRLAAKLAPLIAQAAGAIAASRKGRPS